MVPEGDGDTYPVTTLDSFNALVDYYNNNKASAYDSISFEVHGDATEEFGKKFQRALKRELRKISDANSVIDKNKIYTLNNLTGAFGLGLPSTRMKYDPLTRSFYVPGSQQDLESEYNTSVSSDSSLSTTERRTERAAASEGLVDTSQNVSESNQPSSGSYASSISPRRPSIRRRRLVPYTTPNTDVSRTPPRAQTFPNVLSSVRNAQRELDAIQQRLSYDTSTPAVERARTNVPRYDLRRRAPVDYNRMNAGDHTDSDNLKSVNNPQQILDKYFNEQRLYFDITENDLTEDVTSAYMVIAKQQVYNCVYMLISYLLEETVKFCITIDILV